MLRTHKTYSLVMLGMVTTLIAVVMLLIVVADPQGVYQRFPTKGFNDVKPGFNSYEWMARAIGIENVCANAALFGSSKTLQGLSTASIWVAKDADVRAYNFGIGFPSIVEISDFVRHAHSACRLKKIVIGLDFFMFNAARPRNDKDYLRVLQSSSASYVERLARRLPLHTRMLLSAQNAGDAMNTVKASISRSAPLRDADWTMTDAYYEEKVRSMGGYNAIFEAEMGSYIGYLPPPLYAFSSIDARGRSYYDVFRDLVVFSAQEGIELSVFISPSHAYEFVGLHILNLWDAFEDFKRTTTETLERHSTPVSTGRCRGPMDFAYVHEFAAEPVPPSDSKDIMLYWWESTHYKKNVGQAIAARLKQREISSPDSREFGRCLLTESLSKTFEMERAELHLYIARHSRETGRVHQKIRQSMSSWPRGTTKSGSSGLP